MENKILKSIEQLPGAKFAIGNDLVFVHDFKHSLTDEFKNKVYTANEIAYCDLFDDALLRYASTWAAKEAVYKAVKQLYPDTLPWNKIEITRDKIAGRPRVTITQPALAALNISLTISHDGDYAWAIALVEVI
jgi:holo-[acyl-carrier protein] synthase